MESFQNDWCPPLDRAITYYFSSKRSDTRDVFTSHFGEDDFEEKYTLLSTELSEQSNAFKFSKESMLIDKYSIECISCTLKEIQQLHQIKGIHLKLQTGLNLTNFSD